MKINSVLDGSFLIALKSIKASWPAFFIIMLTGLFIDFLPYLLLKLPLEIDFSLALLLLTYIIAISSIIFSILVFSFLLYIGKLFLKNVTNQEKYQILKSTPWYKFFSMYIKESLAIHLFFTVTLLPILLLVDKFIFDIDDVVNIMFIPIAYFSLLYIRKFIEIDGFKETFLAPLVVFTKLFWQQIFTKQYFKIWSIFAIFIAVVLFGTYYVIINIPSDSHLRTLAFTNIILTPIALYIYQYLMPIISATLISKNE